MKVILVCAQACLCYNTHMEVLNQIRNQISSLILLCGSWGLNSGFQDWRQELCGGVNKMSPVSLRGI